MCPGRAGFARGLIGDRALELHGAGFSQAAGTVDHRAAADPDLAPFAGARTEEIIALPGEGVHIGPAFDQEAAILGGLDGVGAGGGAVGGENIPFTDPEIKGAAAAPVDKVDVRA